MSDDDAFGLGYTYLLQKAKTEEERQNLRRKLQSIIDEERYEHKERADRLKEKQHHAG